LTWQEVLISAVDGGTLLDNGLVRFTVPYIGYACVYPPNHQDLLDPREIEGMREIYPGV